MTCTLVPVAAVWSCAVVIGVPAIVGAGAIVVVGAGVYPAIVIIGAGAGGAGVAVHGADGMGYVSSRVRGGGSANCAGCIGVPEELD